MCVTQEICILDENIKQINRNNQNLKEIYKILQNRVENIYNKYQISLYKKKENLFYFRDRLIILIELEELRM